MNERASRPARILPKRPLRGRYFITDGALGAAELILPTFRGPGGDHEGIAFLAGTEFEGHTLFSAAVAPEADHGPGHVRCSHKQVLAAARAARTAGLAILAQIHSHPGPGSYHSEGDDRMVLMPFEGMLSVVAPHYARYGLRPLDSLGVHQFQDGRWVVCIRETVRSGFRIIPARIDLR